MTVDPWVAWLSLGISIAIYLISAFMTSVYGAGPIAWTRGNNGSDPEIESLPAEVARLDFSGISAAVRTLAVLSAVAGAFSIAFALSETSLSVSGSLMVAGLALAGGYLTVSAVMARSNFSSRNRARSLSLPLGRLINWLIEIPIFRLVFAHQHILEDDAKSEDEALDDRLSLLEAVGISPDPGELEMIRAVMRLDRARIREIMQPRVDMIVADASLSLDELAGVMIDNGHSRIPIYEDSVDKIVGVVHAQDVLRARREAGAGRPMPEIRILARQALFVPESQMLDQLLREFQRGRTQIAIVIDEYGGVSGLVAVQDLIEEIMGELVDEFDTDEPEMQRLSDVELRVDARMPLDTLKQELGVDIDSEGFDTIGGLVYRELGKMPQPGDQVAVEGLRLTVETTMGRRIRDVRVRRMLALIDTE